MYAFGFMHATIISRKYPSVVTHFFIFLFGAFLSLTLNHTVCISQGKYEGRTLTLISIHKALEKGCHICPGITNRRLMTIDTQFFLNIHLRHPLNCIGFLCK